MYAYELSNILLKNPNAEVKLSISDTNSSLCVTKTVKESDIEIENIRNEEYIYLNYDFPIS